MTFAGGDAVDDAREARRARLPRALQGRAARRDRGWRATATGASSKRCSTARSPCPATARSISPRVLAHAARARLSRLAGRRGRAGSRPSRRAIATPRWATARCARSSTARRRGRPMSATAQASLLVKARRDGREHRRRHAASGRLALRRLRARAARPRAKRCARATGATRALHRRARGQRRRAARGDAAWRDIGERASVFEDVAPYAVYLPRRRDVRVTARHDAEIGVASAPGARHACRARLIEPATMRRSVRGTGANTRYVCDILPQTEPAEHLLVVEVITPRGPLVELSAAQARHRRAARRKLARGDLLPPARSAAGLRVPARLHRRSLARRVAGRRGPRRRDGAARLPPGRRAVRLRRRTTST